MVSLIKILKELQTTNRLEGSKLSKNNNIKFPIGNEWLKVDLHIHSPMSNGCYGNKNDEKNWEKFYTELNESGLDVIGINDYFTLAGYYKVKKAKDKGKLNNIKLILPVIEFRTDRIHCTNENITINWHLIFDNNLEENNLEKIYEHLKIVNENNVPTPRPLTQVLMKTIGGNPENSIVSDTLKVFFGSASVYKDNYISILGFSEFNKFKETNKQRGILLAHKVEALFIASELKDIDDRIEKIRKNSLLMEYPIINCSDKHYFKEANTGHCNDFTKFSWMKTVPTFKGIQTAIKNYKDRICLNDPPIDYAKINKIKNIKANVIDNQLLEFNTNGLISIIGNKGQGKSLLGCLVANVSDKNEEVLKKYSTGHHPYDLKPTINALESNNISCKILEQRYIDDITNINPKNGSSELQNELQRIINYGKDKDNLENVITKISNNKDNIKALSPCFNKFNCKKNEQLTNDTNINNLDNQIKQLNSLKQENDTFYKTDDGIEITKLEAEVRTLKERLADMNKILRELDSIEALYGQTIETIDKYNSEVSKLSPSLTDIDNCTEIINKMKIEPSEVPKQELENLKQTINNSIQDARNNINRILGGIKAIKNKHPSIFNAEYKDIEKNLQEQRDSLNIYKNQRERIQNELQSLNSKTAEHKENFKNQFSLLLQKKDFYKEAKDIIDRKIQELDVEELKNNVTFEVSYNNNFITNHIENIQKDYLHGKNFTDILLNNDKKAKIQALEKEIEGAISDEQIKELAGKLHDFILEEFYKEDINKYLIKAAGDESNYLGLIFNIISLEVTYRLKYKGKEITELTPGERGTALVLIYLLLDKEYEKVPLIIDQPEDNIDNQTINTALVPAFKKAKESRQIFLITHNPNLVVNTDSEQIIIAKAVDNKKYAYDSGSLDEERIIEKVCELLEGGREAFQKRNNSYKCIIQKEVTKNA